MQFLRAIQRFVDRRMRGPTVWELSEILDVSRQSVDQTLTRMLERELVTRRNVSESKVRAATGTKGFLAFQYYLSATGERWLSVAQKGGE